VTPDHRYPRLVLIRAGILAVLFALAACSAPSVRSSLLPPPHTASSPSGCDRDQLTALDARGDVDAELAMLAACKSADPELLAMRIDALIDVGETSAARDLAHTVGDAGPPILRVAVERALATKEPSASRADVAADARAAIRGAREARDRADAKAAGRLFARARHLLRKATGSPGRVLDLEIEPVGWAGSRPVLRASAPTSTGGRSSFVLATEVDPSAHTLAPVAAIPSVGDHDVVPWHGHDGSFLVVGPDHDSLLAPPWLAPIVFSSGQATLSDDGRIVAVATHPGLSLFSLADGKEVLRIPNLVATGHGRFLSGGKTYVEVAPTSGSGAHAIVVDVAGERVLLDEAQAEMSALSDSGRYLAIAKFEANKVSVVSATVAIYLRRIDALDHVTRVEAGLFALPYAHADLRFEGELLVTTASTLSALMTEGETDELGEIDAALGRVTSGRAKEPVSRRALFAAITKTAKKFVAPPRDVIDFSLHSQTFDRDRASGTTVIVVGVPAQGMPSSVDHPNLLFIDRAGKLIADAPFAAKGNISTVSLAPGGEAAVVVADDGAYLVDARTRTAVGGLGIPEFDLAPLWSPDGAQLLTFGGVVDVRASSAAGHLVVTALTALTPSSGESQMCWFEPLLAPREACP